MDLAFFQLGHCVLHKHPPGQSFVLLGIKQQPRAPALLLVKILPSPNHLWLQPWPSQNFHSYHKLHRFHFASPTPSQLSESTLSIVSSVTAQTEKAPGGPVLTHNGLSLCL